MPGLCARCCCPVYCAEEKVAIGKVWHSFCFSCCECKKLLDSSSYVSDGQELFCKNCLRWRSNAPDRDDCRCNESCESKPRVRFSPSTLVRCNENEYCNADVRCSEAEGCFPQGDQMFCQKSCPPAPSYCDWPLPCTSYLKSKCCRPCPAPKPPVRCQCCPRNRSRCYSVNPEGSCQRRCPSAQKIQVYLNANCEGAAAKSPRCGSPVTCRVNYDVPCRTRCGSPRPCSSPEPCVRPRCGSPSPCPSPCQRRCPSPRPCASPRRCPSPRPCAGPSRCRVSCPEPDPCRTYDCPPPNCLLNASSNLRCRRCRASKPCGDPCSKPCGGDPCSKPCGDPCAAPTPCRPRRCDYDRPRCQEAIKVCTNPCCPKKTRNCSADRCCDSLPQCPTSSCEPVVLCRDDIPPCAVRSCESVSCSPDQRRCYSCYELPCFSPQEDPVFAFEILLPSEDQPCCRPTC